MKNIKTYDQWNESGLGLSKFLQVGDLVDENMSDYFLEVLPPAYWKNGIIQIGEPCDYVNGRETFDTLKRTSDGWMYAGACHKGKTEYLVNPGAYNA